MMYSLSKFVTSFVHKWPIRRCIFTNGRATNQVPEMSADSEIRKFYAEKSVFITGATGFLGKFLVYKLLKDCPEIKRIYILVRDVTTCKPKLKGIEGDIVLPNYGLSQSCIDELNQNVNIVFHMAATVDFMEPLPTAMKINVNGTRTLIDLCTNFLNLEVLICVTTTYSQIVHKEVHERLYDFPGGWRRAYREKYESDDVKRLIQPWPNTYTYTKAICESMVRELGQKLPVAIFRPAIVISTYQEPFPGWVDNKYGPMGILAYCMSGLLQVLPMDKDANANVVPVDYVVNSILAVSWDVARTYKTALQRPEIPVFNYSSSSVKCTQGDIMLTCGKLCSEYPWSRAVRPARLMVAKNPIVINILTFFYHHLPAFFLDLFLLATFRKPKVMKANKRVDKVITMFQRIIMDNLIFHDDNVVALWDKLNAKDKKIFPFDIKTVKWNEFYVEFVKGIRIFLMKDDLTSLKQAKEIQRKQQVLHLIGKILLLSTLYSVFKFVLKLLFST